MILGLFPEMEGPGGIQRASRHFAAVLARLAASKGLRHRFLSLNDPAGLHRQNVSGVEFEFRGFARHKLRYVLAALATAMRAPKLVFCSHPHLAPIGVPLKKIMHARMAVVGWGIDVWEPLSPRLQSALRASDVSIAISKFTAERMVQAQGVSPAATRVLPLALDPAFWEVACHPRAFQLPHGFPAGRVLLSVTRLAAVEGYKGVDTVIQALPQVLIRVPDVQYVVIGDGDDLPRLQKLSQDLGLTNHVHFLGRLAAQSEELLSCYARCDAFVLPSKGEGFGLVFLEAMAFGKPVVGGAHGGTPDVIEDGRTGYLISHGDTRRLAEVLTELLSNDSLRVEMGRLGRERVESQFLFESFERRLTKILEEACAF